MTETCFAASISSLSALFLAAAADRGGRRLGQREAGPGLPAESASRSPGTAQIFVDPEWRSALIASLAAGAHRRRRSPSPIALPLAWFLWRRIAPWANIFQLLGVAPFILPPVITALGFLTFWATTGFYGQPWTAVDQPRASSS